MGADTFFAPCNRLKILTARREKGCLSPIRRFFHSFSAQTQRGDGLASKPVPALTLGAMWNGNRRGAVKPLQIPPAPPLTGQTVWLHAKYDQFPEEAQ